MDLQKFGEQLQTLRKQAGLSQERLVEALDQRAQLGPVEEYRAVDGTLISRWERAHTQAGRQWKPTRTYLLHLIHIFAAHLTLATAQQWAAQAGYSITPAELQAWFPLPSILSQPEVAPEASATSKPSINRSSMNGMFGTAARVILLSPMLGIGLDHEPWNRFRNSRSRTETGRPESTSWHSGRAFGAAGVVGFD